MKKKRTMRDQYADLRNEIADRVIAMRAKGMGLRPIGAALGEPGKPMSENFIKRVLVERGLFQPLTGARVPKKNREDRKPGRFAHLK